VSDYLGKNLDDRSIITIPSFLLIVSLLISLFFIRFNEMKIIAIIGLCASIFFGIFFFELSLISYLKNILVFKKEDQYYVLNLIFILLGILFFSVFILFKHNMYIYIIASLSLSFGILSLKLFLMRYLSEKISRDISFSIGFGLLGLTIVIFYFIFLRKSFILFIGICLIIFSLNVLYEAIRGARLELERNGIK
jgi:hypothetical protein